MDRGSTDVTTRPTYKDASLKILLPDDKYHNSDPRTRTQFKDYYCFGEGVQWVYKDAGKRRQREREEKREERGRRQLTIDMIAFLPSAYSSIYTVWMEHSRMFYSILLPSIGFFHVPQASISFQGLPCHSIEVHGIPGSLPLFWGVSMPYYGSPIIVTLILRVVPLNLGL